VADAIPDKNFVTAIYSHKLDDLLGLAGIKKHLQDDMKGDPALSAAWGVASKWTETSRYDLWDQFAAESMVEAVGNQTHGVLQWLMKHW
jgi:CheY-specific phosphatase CheX